MKFRQFCLQPTVEDAALPVAVILQKRLSRLTLFEGLNCPVGGAPVMDEAAKILGKVAAAADPTVAVLLCNGSP